MGSPTGKNKGWGTRYAWDFWEISNVVRTLAAIRKVQTWCADCNGKSTMRIGGPRCSARSSRRSHRLVMRSLAERANLLATPSGFWKQELLGAKPIAVC